MTSSHSALSYGMFKLEIRVKFKKGFFSMQVHMLHILRRRCVKTVVEYKKMTGEYHFPSHLSEMASVSFKVAKKAIMFVSCDSKSLYKSRGDEDSEYDPMKLLMNDQFFCLVCTIMNKMDLCIVVLLNSRIF